MSDEEINPSELTWEELAYSNMVQHEAVLRLLVKKGIITKEEFMEEAKIVDQSIQEKKGE